MPMHHTGLSEDSAQMAKRTHAERGDDNGLPRSDGLTQPSVIELASKYCIFKQSLSRSSTMEVIDTLYTVTLQDCPDEVPERARAQAEARYAKALEQALGGPEEVAAALDTMSGLEGAADEDISQADLELAARWAKACTAARQAGFRDLGEAECMYF